MVDPANNACLLISASHLDYGPVLLQRASEYPRWNQLALIGSLTVALVTIALYAVFGPAHAARLPDFALSAITLLLYGFGLFRSFRGRGFGPLAVLAAVAIGVQFAAQIPEVLRAAGLDKEIEANGQKSYRLAIEPQHLEFDRAMLARVKSLFLCKCLTRGTRVHVGHAAVA